MPNAVYYAPVWQNPAAAAAAVINGAVSNDALVTHLMACMAEEYKLHQLMLQLQQQQYQLYPNWNVQLTIADTLYSGAATPPSMYIDPQFGTGELVLYLSIS
ncbi:unnamed protein product [Taenia asiatica]|uniref:Uncharacterized protein n=1 Tax=Taenia asiatica TaxID=60517 RepID=A0A3P6NZW1_TAEAS|nr:unnamed protein product [Taenia asiatica]